VPLVAVYPSDAALASDNPVIVLDAPWSTPTAQAGARAFRTFVRAAAPQKAVAEAGFRPVTGAIDATVLSTRNGVDPDTKVATVPSARGVDVQRALDRAEATHKPANVILLFDASESMQDPADPKKPDGPSKIELARAAAKKAIEQLAPDVRIELRIFTTKLPESPSRSWSTLVPFGEVSEIRAALLRAIDQIEPQQGSPLYAAIRDAQTEVARFRGRPIAGVVVLTDGYNEVDDDNDRDGLLADLAAYPGVRVFPVAYSNDADITTLRKVADATNARLYDARDTKTIDDALARALSNF
jgi:Ca-activated chloride channel homolog